MKRYIKIIIPFIIIILFFTIYRIVGYIQLQNIHDDKGFIGINYTYEEIIYNATTEDENSVKLFFPRKTSQAIYEFAYPISIEINEKINFKHEIVTDTNIIKVNVTITDENENTVYEGEKIDDLFSILSDKEDGFYYIETLVNYTYKGIKGSYKNKSKLYLDFPVEVVLSDHEVSKGDLIKVVIKNKNKDEQIISSSNLYNFNLKVFEQDNEFIGYIPINFHTPLGKFNLEICNNYHEIEVIDKKFNIARFNVPQTIVSDTSNQQAYNEYIKNKNLALANPLPQKLYEKEFIRPTDGRLTSDFGDTRYINGSTKPSSIHYALDIANALNTEIRATATGKVVLAKYLTISGNTIIIDHGHNIYSHYAHANKLLVSEGDLVSQGDVIALMGTTGFSTGVHLHFAFTIGSTYVSPWEFIDKWE